MSDEYAKWLRTQGMLNATGTAPAGVRFEGAPLNPTTPQPATPDWPSTNTRPLVYPGVEQESGDLARAVSFWCAIWCGMFILGTGIGFVIKALN